MSWLPFAIAAAVSAAAVHLVIAMLAGVLTRLPAVGWPALRVVAALVMIGFAGWVALAPAHTAVPATCVVTEVTMQKRPDDVPDVRVRVRWQAAGREFHLREPMSIARARGNAKELVTGHANQPVPCYVTADRPGRIFLGDAARATREQWAKAAAITVPAIGLIGIAIVAWRRRSSSEGRRTAGLLSSRGTGGLIGLGVVLLGMALQSWLLAGAGGAWLLWLFVREVMKSNQAVAYLTHKLALVAQPERVFAKLQGTRDAAVIEIEETTDQLSARVELVGWPEDVSIRLVTDVEPADGTGDRTFDARFVVEGPPDRWRALLTHDVRAALGQVILAEASWIDHGKWHAIYEDDVADGRTMERDIERALALRRLITTEATATPHERVLAVARTEPDAVVRFGHYRWLVAAGYPAAAVALAAADDPDETIRTWIRDQVAPPDGAFR